MLRIIRRGLIASAMTLSFTAGALATPLGLSDSTAHEDAHASVDEARVFCFNRASGRFLHWGSCYARAAPRVYCRNRWSGQFLHWGSC